MKNNTSKVFFLIFFLLCFIFPTTCKKLEKVMLVSTGDVSNITTNTAEASGVIIDLGEGGTQHGHCYAITPNVNVSGTKTQLGVPSTVDFTSQLTNLESGTKYFVKSYISNANETVYGEEKSFTTIAISPPTIETISITSITTTTATSGGNITSDGGASVTVRGVCWSIASSPTTDDGKTIDGTGTGSFASNLSGLAANTTYYIRAYATNIAGTAYGNELSFITDSTIPTLSTTAITSITTTTATSGGDITDDGGPPVTARGICWNYSGNPSINDSITKDGTGLGSFISQLTGLQVNTTYYVSAYAINSVGNAYGLAISFKTRDGIAALTTTQASVIMTNSATSGGNITDDGGAFVTVRGVCWNTTGNPTLESNDGYTSDGSGIGNYTTNLTGLQLNTSYYVRGYATTDYGISYGDEKTFLTKGLPEVTLAEISKITDTSAVCGGEVTNDWGFPVTIRGVCWNKTGNPTLESNESFSQDGSGMGNFNSYLTGLIKGATYYVSAYATNSIGTSYSDEKIFEAIEPFECGTGTISDYDGNIYKTVQIGSQCWLKENMKTTHYSDGTALVDGTGVGDITGDYITKYWFVWHELYNKDIYGLLYTWAAAMNGASSSDANPSGVQGVCPTGWHLPSDAEWKQLEMHLGMSQAEADRKGWRGTDEGGKLKETGTILWLSPNNGATNESGFSGLPGGYRYSAGPVFSLGSFGYWWSSLEDAFYRDLNYNLTTIYRYDTNKDWGFSVRCVKD
ncbi:MAG TPA: fibrobacter succinogenes major paralogous domain-containing protein [Bacteroidales bacterium]|nr:fibrobacter succinogenes major paralogous domain-containing protein [Bacteroidales bacterium]